MSDRRKSKKKKKYVDKDSPPGSRDNILKRNISGHIERPSVSKWDTQTDSFDITQTIHIWVRKDDDDPLPFEITNLHMTIHDLKIQLFKVFGDDLELTKPNKLKLRVNGNILLPQNKVYQVLFDGATLDIFVNSAVDFDEIDTQGNETLSAMVKVMKQMQKEIIDLKKRLHSEQSHVETLNTTPNERAINDTTSTTKSLTGDSFDMKAVLNRLEAIEAKIDRKNLVFDNAAKDLKILTSYMHGMGIASNIADPKLRFDAVPISKAKASLEGHGGPVWALAKKDNMLFSGSSDTTVQVWDMNALKPISTLTGHLSIVHSIDTWNKYVISGSDDRTIKFWDSEEDWKCTKTLRVNNVACVLKVASNLLFAGSYKTVKVWDLENGYEQIKDLGGQTHWVRALQISKGHLYCGGYNVIDMWDLGTLKKLKSMTRGCGSIYSIQVSGNLLFSATYENTINVWDLRTFECIKTLPGHSGAVYSITMANNKLYSGSYDNTIRVWDLNSFQCVQKLTGHTGSVEALESINDFVFSGSTDGTVKVWR